jgi:hypothetical protein
MGSVVDAVEEHLGADRMGGLGHRRHVDQRA